MAQCSREILFGHLLPADYKKHNLSYFYFSGKGRKRTSVLLRSKLLPDFSLNQWPLIVTDLQYVRETDQNKIKIWYFYIVGFILLLSSLFLLWLVFIDCKLWPQLSTESDYETVTFPYYSHYSFQNETFPWYGTCVSTMETSPAPLICSRLPIPISTLVKMRLSFQSLLFWENVHKVEWSLMIELAA